MISNKVQVVAAIGKPPEGSCFSRERLKNTVVFSIRGNIPRNIYVARKTNFYFI